MEFLREHGCIKHSVNQDVRKVLPVHIAVETSVQVRGFEEEGMLPLALLVPEGQRGQGASVGSSLEGENSIRNQLLQIDVSAV